MSTGGVLFSIADFGAIAARALVALLACTLPRRIWTRWSDRLPVFHMAIPSALLTLVAGFVIGVIGYVEFATEAASRNNAMLLEIARRQQDGTAPAGADASTAMSMSLMVLAAITFMFFTPRGLLSTYLAASGLLRMISAFVGDPRGDPALTLAHLLFGRTAEKVEDRAAVRQRLRREGPEVPDELTTGEQAGMPRADLVVVASRRKPDWTQGTVLNTNHGWFRVGEPKERELPAGLRTYYPLVELGRAEIFRKVVRYRLPPLLASIEEEGVRP